MVFLLALDNKNYTMTFKGNSAGVTDIIPCGDNSVSVSIWRISAADKRRLDIYEGYPKLYGKRRICALYGSRSVEGMIYVMNTENPVKIPSEAYFNTVLQGYLDFGIDAEIFLSMFQKSRDVINLKIGRCIIVDCYPC